MLLPNQTKRALLLKIEPLYHQTEPIGITSLLSCGWATAEGEVCLIAHMKGPTDNLTQLSFRVPQDQQL
jgi:hypothetical protein